METLRRASLFGLAALMLLLVAPRSASAADEPNIILLVSDDTGYGDQLPRYTWTEEQLSSMIARLLGDKAMKQRLNEVAKHMQAAKGTEKAANILAEIATTGSFKP